MVKKISKTPEKKTKVAPKKTLAKKPVKKVVKPKKEGKVQFEALLVGTSKNPFGKNNATSQNIKNMAKLLKNSAFKGHVASLVDDDKKRQVEIERITNLAIKNNNHDIKTVILVYYSGDGGVAKDYTWQISSQG